MSGIRTASLTDVGRIRQRNEDAIFAGQTVFAVADGLGGHRAGEVASTVALEPIAALDQLPPKDAAKRLVDAVRKANRTVFERAQDDDELQGMGTTMTAVVIAGDTAHLAHVGDSRCYLIRGQGLTRISRDHTLVARMVDEGKLTPEQAEQHPQRSILTRALGHEPMIDVEEATVHLVAGDRLVLCSDGLTGVVGDDELRAFAGDGADLDEIAQRLVDEANARGGPDNISVVLVDVGDSVPAARGRRFARGRPREPRRFPVRAAVWAAVLSVAMIGGYFGLQAWANRSYYVGVTDNGTVAIYRGIPVEVPGLSLSDMAEPTDLQADEVANPAVRRSLERGVRLPSLEEARAYVQRLTDDARLPGGPAPPVPRPTDSPSPEGSP